MQIAIIQFPGSNCERETRLAVQRAGMCPVDFFWNDPLENLMHYDGFIIVGGFSYEDRARAGIIAASHPLTQQLKKQCELGKPILGICNGAQILVEAGFVPGLNHAETQVALTNNKRMQQGKVLGTGYYNAWVHVRLSRTAKRNAFTRHLDTQHPLPMPIAHAEGRFMMSAETLEILHHEGIILLQYSDAQGATQDEFPTNPNGSLDNIAAIGNQAGNVMAIMPHPERTAQADAIFTSMRDYIAEAHYCALPLPARSVHKSNPIYTKPAGSFAVIIESIITDNVAFTVEHSLKMRDIAVQITRQTYWQIRCQSQSVFHQIQATGLLFNEHKEQICHHHPTPDTRSFLVLSKDNILGLQVQQRLFKQYQLAGIADITQGVLWHIKADPARLEDACTQIFHSGILFNPITQECFQYVSL